MCIDWTDYPLSYFKSQLIKSQLISPVGLLILQTITDSGVVCVSVSVCMCTRVCVCVCGRRDKNTL